MLNNGFLKKLTILYVEDDDVAREQFGKSLKRLFKNVILGCNGEDGYNKFQEAREQNIQIDLILSDINMPKMDGLAMLEKIRKTDENIPVMYTTARTEVEYMQKAIDLNVYHYAFKPINLDDIILRIQKVCEKQYYQMVIDSKNNELKNYLNIINNVAAILKFNENGEITFINDLFCELFEQEKDSLVGQSFTALFNKKVSSSVESGIWESITNNKTWNGDIKYDRQKDDSFFIRSTIFKQIDDNSFEYVSIGFLSTDEVDKQRQFHKNVLQTISNKSIESSKFKNELESTYEENKKLKEENKIFNAKIKQYKNLAINLKGQVDTCQQGTVSNDTLTDKSTILRNNKELKTSSDKIHKENKLLSSQNLKLEEENSFVFKEIEKLKNLMNQKEKRIEVLEDILEHRESQIRKFDPSLLS